MIEPAERPGPDEDRDSEQDIGMLVRAGTLVELRRHLGSQRETFVRWYQDPEIAELLRHDLTPLGTSQARGYYDSIIMPATARETCWAIHEHEGNCLVGSTALTDINERTGTSLFRLVIGDKAVWGRGYGTEATRLVLDEAFNQFELNRVSLEVFAHNPRAHRAYLRAGFVQTGQHFEWVASARRQIEVLEMAIDRSTWHARAIGESGRSLPSNAD